MARSALPGFRDFYPDEFARRAHIFRAWREVARRYAFVEYDGPPLEPLDLYTKKSGDEIVAQLYAFEDKGGRQVALRPEMTPTLARMVAARAQALRKPIRWYSIPQLFRYERQQKGRLREHFQLNVDIVGEPSELADAELLAVALDCMRELGLGPDDVRARVSDRSLLNAALDAIGVTAAQRPAVYAVLDKVARQPHGVSKEKLAGAGLAATVVDRVLRLPDAGAVDTLRRDFGKAPKLIAILERFERYLGHLDALGVRAWVDVDLSIVRGLAYYTGIVFELFDARGALRAICGGGRYDTLLKDLGGADLPALGFGMGDVVLGELLSQRSGSPAAGVTGADVYVVGGAGALHHGMRDALRVVSHLRRAGLSVDYALSEEKYAARGFHNQLDAARKTGAACAAYFESDTELVVQGLLGKLSDAPRAAVPAASALDGDGETLERVRAFILSVRGGASH